MLGDVVIRARRFIKQQTCIHDYEEHVIHATREFYYQECKKCGKWR